MFLFLCLVSGFLALWGTQMVINLRTAELNVPQRMLVTVVGIVLFAVAFFVFSLGL